MSFARVSAKLHTMRKPQNFSVRPMSDGQILVQSDKSIGTFDFRTRRGVLNTKGCYFPHLSPLLGAFRFEFPEEFVRQCLEACPSLDGETDLGGVIVQHTVTVIGGADGREKRS